MRKPLSLLLLTPIFRAFHNHRLFGRNIYIKRDDLSNGVNGNKARKFSWILNNCNDMVYGSYGGIQSNSMNALSVIANAQNKPFVYFTDSTYNVATARGNLKRSLDRGMKVCEM